MPRVPRPLSGCDIRKLPLSPPEAFLLSRIDAVVSERELSLITGLSPAEVAAALDRLSQLGAIDFAPDPPRAEGSDRAAESAKTPPPDPARPAAAATPVPPGATPPLYDPAELDEDIEVEPEKRRRVLDLYYRLDDLTHYEVLGVTEQADKKQIKGAYYALAPEFHPDKYFRKRLGSFKAKIETVFNRITQAHDVLTSKQRRAEYDEYLEQLHRNRAMAALLDQTPRDVARVSAAVDESAAAAVGARPPVLEGAPLGIAGPTPISPFPGRYASDPTSSPPSHDAVASARPRGPLESNHDAAASARPRGPLESSHDAAASARPRGPLESSHEAAASARPRGPLESSHDAAASARPRGPLESSHDAAASARPRPPFESSHDGAASARTRIAPEPLSGREPVSGSRVVDSPAASHSGVIYAPAPSGPGSSPRSVDLSPDAHSSRRETLARKLAGGVFRKSSPPPPLPDPLSAQRAAESLRHRYEAALAEARRVQLQRYLEAGKSALDRKDFAGAANAYRIAASLAPGDREVQATCDEAMRLASAALAEGYWKQAQYEESQGHWAEAALSYSKACAGRPGDARAHERVAFATLKSSVNMRRAIDFARRAVELAPGSPELRLTLARAYAAAGFEKSARGEIERALELAPNDAKIRELSAQVREQTQKNGKSG